MIINLPASARRISRRLIGCAAVVIVLLQNIVSSYTERWATIMAVMFIGVVMFARGGIWGLIAGLAKREARR